MLSFFQLCLLVFISISQTAVAGVSRQARFNGFTFGNKNNFQANIKPGFPSIAGNSNVRLGDNTNLNAGGKYNYMSNNWNAGVGLNHKFGGSNVGIGANYNSATKGMNVGAKANFDKNINAGVGYNSANKGVGANFGINFRRTFPGTFNYAQLTRPAVGRQILLRHLYFLHETIGSRHPEMLKVNISQESPHDQYTYANLIEDLHCIEKSLGEAFPRICKFMQLLISSPPCVPLTDSPTARIGPSSKPATLSTKDQTVLKAFAAMVVYADLQLKLAQAEKMPAHVMSKL
ncbi:uncharacterized protein LOC134188947 [Corticium candelabrum]|uniref:uncharacterized protein LOC134188947 n=1 Tax=Corticium candelabrum TaxID=121492 RepID=UPI002E25AFE6|nr:uncharacterized protein LOC134188947 [Corticium candelabrum]